MGCAHRAACKFFAAALRDLRAFAEHEFRQAPRGDGGSEHDHLQSAARQLAAMGGRKPVRAPVLKKRPLCPAQVEYLWFWFLEIVRGIGSGGFGPPVVTWADLHFWQHQMGVRLRPWEAMTLVDLGNLRASIANEEAPKVNVQQPNAPKRAR